MRRLASIATVSGLALLFAVTGLASHAGPKASENRVGEIHLDPLVAGPTVTEIAEDRRLQLEARLHRMVQSGSGERLKDGQSGGRDEPSVRSVRPTNITAAAANFPATRQLAAQTEATTSFTPPPVNPLAPVTRGRGYRTPRLDLTTPPLVPKNDLECLTQAIYYEARNESEDGQAAVAEVVLNRSRSGAFPRNLCAVVYQRNARTCQFTFTCDGSIGRGPVDMKAWARAERIARSVHSGFGQSLLPHNSVNYHANYVRPSWSQRLERVRQIGAHIFYAAPRPSGSALGSRAQDRPDQNLLGLQFVRIDALDQAFSRIGDSEPES